MRNAGDLCKHSQQTDLMACHRHRKIMVPLSFRLHPPLCLNPITRRYFGSRKPGTTMLRLRKQQIVSQCGMALSLTNRALLCQNRGTVSCGKMPRLHSTPFTFDALIPRLGQKNMVWPLTISTTQSSRNTHSSACARVIGSSMHG